jgi:hypothetical protein
MVFQPEVGVKRHKQGVQKSSCIHVRSSFCSKAGTYTFSKGTFSHLGGRFFPSCGHAGQSSAHSPGLVAVIQSLLVL